MLTVSLLDEHSTSAHCETNHASQQHAQAAQRSVHRHGILVTTFDKGTWQKPACSANTLRMR
jgi:hypothetical protein